MPSIGLVTHQAEVEVNEEGTEAVVLTKRPRAAGLVANHPFLFLIRDKQSGSILFIGRVVNPE